MSLLVPQKEENTMPPTFIPIETDGGAAYTGTVAAQAYEVTPPGDIQVTNLIRTDQAWGIQFDWTFQGNITQWLNYHWHLRVYLESIGTGPEYDLPAASAVIVPTSDGAVAGNTRTYTKKVEFDPAIVSQADKVQPGVYKPVAFIQLYDAADTMPAAICGTVDLPPVTFYKPA
jgi:hypothetical protein